MTKNMASVFLTTKKYKDDLAWYNHIVILYILHALLDGSWAQCYKTFYGRNLQMFIISSSLVGLSSLV